MKIDVKKVFSDTELGLDRYGITDKHLSIFSRKAPYSYGWDWGIRMVTSGIWRPVTIRFYDAASISDYHVKQLALTDQLANLSNELEINNILSQP